MAFVSRLNVCSECCNVIGFPRPSNEDKKFHSRSRSPEVHCLNTRELLRDRRVPSHATSIPDFLRILRGLPVFSSTALNLDETNQHTKGEAGKIGGGYSGRLERSPRKGSGRTESPRSSQGVNGDKTHA